MKVKELSLPGLLLVEPKRFGDHRGYFVESWNKVRYEKVGISSAFVQDNLSFSKKGVLRGLHFQQKQPQGKLVTVLQGEVFDVAVDIRLGSPAFGQWEAVSLSGENGHQLYVPEGMAHGFCIVSDEALFAYKCTDFYHPESEHTLLWNDPDIGIAWPLASPALSEKDAKGLPLRALTPSMLPAYSK